jgi:hypothetical protein
MFPNVCIKNFSDPKDKRLVYYLSLEGVAT